MTQLSMPLTGTETTARIAHQAAGSLQDGLARVSAGRSAPSAELAAPSAPAPGAPVGTSTALAAALGLGVAVFLAGAALALV